MAGKILFVERMADGRYAVKEKNVAKPLATADTQAEAITKAQAMQPSALHVERVRDVGPGPDKWRKL